MTDYPLAYGRLVAIAGALPVLAGLIALMGIISDETRHPGSSTARTAISDLGASLRRAA